MNVTEFFSYINEWTISILAIVTILVGFFLKIGLVSKEEKKEIEENLEEIENMMKEAEKTAKEIEEILKKKEYNNE